KELADGNYHDLESVQRIEEEIKVMWERMLALLKQHQDNLAIASAFMNSIKEIQTVESELNELKGRINLDANVAHLRAAEQYLQTHSLMEAQISSHGDTVRRLTSTAKRLTADETTFHSKLIEKELPMLKQGIDSLNQTYTAL